MTSASKGTSMLKSFWRRRFGQCALVSALASPVLAGCGSDLTCGAGTKESGDKCVPATAGVITDGGLFDSAPVFDGITSVAPASTSSLQITWDPAVDDLSPRDQIVYRVYVATASGDYNFGQPSAVSAPGATSIVVGNLQRDTEYFILVRAVDTAGNEDGNNNERTGTPTADTEPPEFGGALYADSVSSNSVVVSWEPATDDLTPPEGISYTVRWSDQGGAAAVLGTIGALTAPGATSAVIEGLPEPVTSYYFYVQARDAAGNVDSNQVTVEGETGPDVTPPTFAGCTSAAEPGATRATVSWVPASDDTTDPDDILYNVYAFTEPVDAETPFGAALGTFTGGSLGVVSGLQPSTTYYLVCRAMDTSGNEDQNIAFRSVTTRQDSEPPVFAGIAGLEVDATTAELKWAPAEDDQTPPEEIIYLVYQSTEPNPVATGELISPGPAAGATSFFVQNLNSRTQYYWTVRASDGAGNMDDNTVTATEVTLVSFANDVQPIFTTSCAKTNCHLGEAAMQGMRLEEGYAYAHTVNTPSVFPTELNPTFGARLDRVEPGDVQRSFLWHKLMDTELTGEILDVDPPVTWAFGGGMPKDTYPTKLPQPDLDTIQAWILQGARNN